MIFEKRTPRCKNGPPFFTDSALWAGSVIELQCPSVCMSVTSQNTHFRVSCRLLVKEVILLLACDDTIFKTKKCVLFFSEILKRSVLDHPTVDSGGVSSGKYVALAVDCLLLALQGHFKDTSMTLPQHFHSIPNGLTRHIKKNNNKNYIGGSIRTG